MHTLFIHLLQKRPADNRQAAGSFRKNERNKSRGRKMTDKKNDWFVTKPKRDFNPEELLKTIYDKNAEIAELKKLLKQQNEIYNSNLDYSHNLEVNAKALIGEAVVIATEYKMICNVTKTQQEYKNTVILPFIEKAENFLNS